MTQLTVNTPRVYELGDENTLPVAEGEKISEGSAIGITPEGFARPLQAGDTFGGFAIESADATDAGDGEKSIRTRYKGAIELEVAGLTAAHVGEEVYAADGDTFVLASSNNTKIGKILRVDGKTAVISFKI